MFAVTPAASEVRIVAQLICLAFVGVRQPRPLGEKLGTRAPFYASVKKLVPDGG
jgi:hypothetical protein